MIFIVAKYLIPKGYLGLTLFPFVFVKNKLNKNNAVFVNHEKIHLRQQLELLVIPFLIWYLAEFFFRLLHYKNFDLAYKNISFEREAYHQETNWSYLKSRNAFSFFYYL